MELVQVSVQVEKRIRLQTQKIFLKNENKIRGKSNNPNGT